MKMRWLRLSKPQIIKPASLRKAETCRECASILLTSSVYFLVTSSVVEKSTHVYVKKTFIDFSIPFALLTPVEMTAISAALTPVEMTVMCLVFTVVFVFPGVVFKVNDAEENAYCHKSE